MTALPGPGASRDPGRRPACGENIGSWVEPATPLVVPAQHDHLTERRATATADMLLVAERLVRCRDECDRADPLRSYPRDIASDAPM